jgi:hypothetical protein
VIFCLIPSYSRRCRTDSSQSTSTSICTSEQGGGHEDNPSAHLPISTGLHFLSR